MRFFWIKKRPRLRFREQFPRRWLGYDEAGGCVAAGDDPLPPDLELRANPANYLLPN